MTESLSSALVPAREPTGVGRGPRLEVGVTEGPAETIVRLAGPGCVGQADALTAGLLGLSARRPALLTLDLSGLRCLSCLTLGVLVTFRRGVVRRGGRVGLAAALQEPVRAALERAGLLALLSSAGGPESATPPAS